jgi:hypothetical protein
MAEVLAGIRRFMALTRHTLQEECTLAPSVGSAMEALPGPIPSEDNPALADSTAADSTAEAFTAEAEAATAAGATDNSFEVIKP